MGDLPLPASSGSVVFGEPPSASVETPAAQAGENFALLDVLREAVAVGTQPTDSILESIAETAGVLSGAAGIAIALRQNGVIICRARSGDIAPELGSPLNTDSGISGECLRAAAILVCSDTATDKRVDAEVCERLGLKSIVAVPLRGRMGMVGILEAFSSRASAFEKEQIEALRALGEITERAYERERRRLEPVAPAKSRNPLVAAAIKSNLAQTAIEEISLKRGYWILGAVTATVLLVSLVIGLSWRQTGADIAANASPAKSATAQRAPQGASASPVRVAEVNPTAEVALRQAKHETSGGLIHKAAEISREPDPSNASQPDASRPTADGSSAGPSSGSRSLGSPASGEASSANPVSANLVSANPAPPASATKTESNEDAAPIVEISPSSAPDDLTGISSASAALPAFGGNVSQGFNPAVLVKKVEPEYPVEAQKEKISGPITLEATVAENGTVRAVNVVRGSGQLAEAAKNAVRQWKYRAAVLNGKPVETQKQITVVFKLP
jgi:TonB family protein